MIAFFIECSVHETDANKKVLYESIAVGKTFTVRDGYLYTAKDRFKIPSEYSDRAKRQLDAKLTRERDKFDALSDEINEARLSWGNLKKRDKMRRLDDYVSSLDCTLAEKVVMKKNITIAFVLKLIPVADICYQDYRVTRLEGSFDDDYLTEINAA